MAIILSMIELKTKKLILRQWQESDFPFYAKLTADREIMKFFPRTLSLEESTFTAKKFMKLIANRSWGFWAVEEKSSGKFIGYAGLHAPQTQFPFSPCVEIAWRMPEKYWENGYALEAGKEILTCAFKTIGLEKVLYFSSIHNVKAEEIVKELGMLKQEENFYHPFVERGHKLSEHYLYEIKKQ